MPARWTSSPDTGDDISERSAITFIEFPKLRHIVQTTNLADSQYDSLQASYNQRDWHGLDTAYNFTWSKCFDENSFNRGGTGDYPQLQNPSEHRRQSRPLRPRCAPQLQRQRRLLLPAIPALGERLGKGWQLSTIYTAISGRPFSVLLGSGADPSGQGMSGSSIRAAWDGTPVKIQHAKPEQYIVEQVGGTDPCGRTWRRRTAVSVLRPVREPSAIPGGISSLARPRASGT